MNNGEPEGRASVGKSSNGTMDSTLEVSDQTSKVSAEIWALIASYASRQSVARLCAVSRTFHSTLSAPLYTDVLHPPLTATQSSRLIRTLRTETAIQPHPATFIRELGLKASKNVHKNLFRFIPSGSPLRVLHWNMNAGLDELGQLLGKPDQFPNLRELCVSSSGMNKNFNFIQTKGLEVLRLNMTIYSCNDLAPRLHKLGEAIQMLPTSSPLLTELQLKLQIPYDGQGICPRPGTPGPHLGLSDLVSVINLVHLPALATLDISMDLNPADFEEYDAYDFDFLPEMDFFPFLASHPTLFHLTLNAKGTDLTTDDTFLPQLRSFEGSFYDAAVICNGQRQLNTLVIPFVHYGRTHNNPTYFETVPLPSHLSLTKLKISAVDDSGSAIKAPNELSPDSFAELVSSFPNLTYLDACLNKPMTAYRKHLAVLVRLEYLRLQEYRTGTEIFSPNDYITEFNHFLPFLPHLAHIEICLFADRARSRSRYDEYDDSGDSGGEGESCPCCRYGFFLTADSMVQPSSDTKVDYSFSVTRPSNGTEVVLTGSRVWW
ncbi:hypothetical protein B0H16DRAFT_1554394 [Mycena metata]|uniref:F-box domain-containing protein n=1 Tax=Mycena metata TaxID=1033252 RepID=A0AAD7DY54_9AGAR|nr:hypothetical protein B0H16DRAFT_1640342 [Mycena metata]KAJ7747737.1 hypothetical protein B0H16DRAFT_1554394 [Mycena metata]